MKNLLLTGPPSCGKTTAVLRLGERLTDLRLAGLYTRELREQGNRVGFEAVGVSTGQRALLAHIRSPSRLRIGRYGVETVPRLLAGPVTVVATVANRDSLPAELRQGIRRRAVT
jgi:nucleoside-triphosphatase THEP1